MPKILSFISIFINLIERVTAIKSLLIIYYLKLFIFHFEMYTIIVHYVCEIETVNIHLRPNVHLSKVYWQIKS